MTIWEFIRLRVATDLTIALVSITVLLLIAAIIEFVKFCVWYHDHRKRFF